MDWSEIWPIMDKIELQYAMEKFEQKAIFEIIKDMDHPVFCEVGVAHGRTSAMLCYVAKNTGGQFYGVDNWSMGSTLDEVQGMLQKNGFNPIFISADSRNVTWTGPDIDFLIIDGGHYEDPVKSDCAKFVPHVKPGGYVAFDDWVDDDSVNAHMAIRKYGTIATQGWEKIAYLQGTMIFRRPLNA
jgi:hypothetical protein